MGAREQHNANSWMVEFADELRAAMRAEWRDKAACTDAEPDLFDDYWGGTEAHPFAIETCHSCPVIDQCREHAIAFEAFGTWGGMTAKEREAIRGRKATRRLGAYGF